MFLRLGHFIYRARWQVIAIWVVMLAICLPFVSQASSVLKGGGFANGVSESDRASTLLVRDLHFYPSNLTIIFSSATLRATDPRFRQAMVAALAPAARLPHVVSIETYYQHTPLTRNQQFISDDRHSTIAILNYNANYDLVETLVPHVRATLQSPTLRVIVAGDAAVFSDMETVSNQDLQTVEKYTFPIALILLVLIFGTLVSSLIPVITGGMAVAITLAILYWLGHVTDLSIFALNVTSMIGLGVGIDYALFVVSRFREEIRTRSVEDAVAITMATAGRAVVFSGITVMIGLAGLLIFHAMALRSIGLGGSMVVGISVIAATTLLPALLSVLGTRIDALKLVPWRMTGSSPFWHTLATRVMRHPWPVIAAVLVAVAVIASPFRALHMNIPDATILSTSVPSRYGYDVLNSQFHQNQNNPVLVVVHAPGNLLAPARMAALYDYVHTLAKDPAIKAGRVESLVTVEPRASRADYSQIARYRAIPAVAAAIAAYTGNNSTYITLWPKPDLSQSQIENLVRRVRAVPLGAGMARYVGGYNAGVIDYLANLYGQFPLVIAVVVLITYLILTVVLRSAILPLKAVLMNALSLLGAYGAVVFIFQQGHLSTLLNFTPTGYIDETTPIILFCTLFGLSMDYEVFLLSRMREQWLLTGNNAASVALGLERTGRIITSAALILVVVAGSFAFTNIVLVKAVGLGLAIAILLDATLIRCLLVPATMRVLGHWNWWLPRFLRPLIGDNTPITAQPADAARHVA
ncbi:MAG TPA: MMPL family transporter [Chloroflexota bacterium]|nr:MMPL family transporter [Chloroflexota bacterium]